MTRSSRSRENKAKPEDGPRCTIVDVNAFATTHLDLLRPSPLTSRI